MKVLVTGASGYIGGSVATALLAAGHRVVGLVRSDERAAKVQGRGIEPLIGTLDDGSLLADAARAQRHRAGLGRKARARRGDLPEPDLRRGPRGQRQQHPDSLADRAREKA